MKNNYAVRNEVVASKTAIYATSCSLDEVDNTSCAKTQFKIFFVIQLQKHK